MSRASHPTSHSPRPTGVTRIGLISDTHGLLRPSVHEALKGVEVILHAGDVGGDEILDELALIAPVHAVSGNTDDAENPRLRKAIELTFAGIAIHVSHGHEIGVPRPEKLLARYAADVIVYGHTHMPLVTKADGRLLVNPGAAGPARFDIKPSVGILEIADGVTEARILPIE